MEYVRIMRHEKLQGENYYMCQKSSFVSISFVISYVVICSQESWSDSIQYLSF